MQLSWSLSNPCRLTPAGETIVPRFGHVDSHDLANATGKG
jgi:hypothetical protein